MNKYIIKFYNLYYCEYIGDGQYSQNIEDATKYVHVDIARQKILDKKLNDECKVWQVNFVEQEVK